MVAFTAFAYGAYVFLAWLVQDIPVRGFAPLVIVLAFTAGIQMTMLGVLGEYLWRTLDETRRRPGFVIDEVFDDCDDIAASAPQPTDERGEPNGFVDVEVTRGATGRR